MPTIANTHLSQSFSATFLSIKKKQIDLMEHNLKKEREKDTKLDVNNNQSNVVRQGAKEIERRERYGEVVDGNEASVLLNAPPKWLGLSHSSGISPAPSISSRRPFPTVLSLRSGPILQCFHSTFASHNCQHPHSSIWIRARKRKNARLMPITSFFFSFFLSF